MGLPELFQQIRADHRDSYEGRTGPVDEVDLVALEERLAVSLPEELRQFLRELGPGDFSFGRIFSPLLEGGTSEMEDELKAFEESEADKIRVLSVRPRLPSVALLPFGRRAGRLYLFDLVGRSPADTVWAIDTLAEPADEATPTTKTLLAWLEGKLGEQSGPEVGNRITGRH